MNSSFISANDWISLTIRLTFASLVGGAIGWERQMTGRSAGIRTYMLISLGAAMFVMLPLQIPDFSSANALSRTIQGVATGVGFIGAGLILQQSNQLLSKPKIKGLTSAATIWVTAALGAAIGCGLWQMSLLGTIITLVILSGVKKLKKSLSINLDYPHKSALVRSQNKIENSSDLSQLH
ncbi:MAG TPA: hypothetical protein DEG17_13115 [Cyanobacteria bacterium UBA11149]|nr:hypothetical protein [Cyanobacteria bacterium UBA11367]HBE60511.1 hypothetical protein [Cyanobacteria bacterium UBA11366]HBK62533.1 hypothetical protein [Cyanobacteria bacterium UBA11166]HBR75069.1 hypothetical protein [Cyanobacteria bacterium UBA11159]HBS71270.1 hypothetical protein [Cyanobacteria bacterium UBA11153]HBW89780.1 hypothetical protein [Cyanobacteria bacterium UBA11149]HCA96070.1 hypothetical protein [Cyanobacteria bacterium UBA9226]